MRSKCKKCGLDILWIKTTYGKSMPCDPKPVTYKHGTKDKLIIPNGMTITCEIQDMTTNESIGVGYVPHWATCPYADSFRKKDKT